MEITKIVITGGPCAGKTTAMSWVQNAFTAKGYEVLFVPETATEMITGGIVPARCQSVGDFQKCLMVLQMEKEKVFEMSAKIMKADKVLIVCDRGVMDSQAYMTQEEFQEALDSMNTSEVELRDKYDAIFHLVTAAKGAEDFYTTSNNTARTETPEEAAILDDKLIAAWTGHPHLRIIDNDCDFDGKMLNLISEISSLLGETRPFEIERKYLIEYPDIEWLLSLPNCEKLEIIQTYLHSDDGSEVRIRQRGINGSYIYYKTVKRNVSGIKRVEVEQRLSEKEYLSLLMEADTSRRQIRKDRYCLTYEGQYFEIDVYPFWDDKAIIGIKLSNEDEQVSFPENIKVIKEVTNDADFKNAALAAKK